MKQGANRMGQKKIMRQVLITIQLFLAFIGIVAIIMLIIGYKPIRTNEMQINWTVFKAITDLMSPIITVTFTAYITNIVTKSKQVIGQANAIQANDFKRLEQRITQCLDQMEARENNDIQITNIDNEDDGEIREKAYKFINIAMITTTHGVAEYLDITDKKAFEILKILNEKDKKIRSRGKLVESNMNHVKWLRKD
jgi:hypothetical protein